MSEEPINYREHIDSEYQRWERKYPRFPGVSECARLIDAQLPESVSFLSGDVLQEGNPMLASVAQRALEQINARESRSAVDP